MVTRPGPHPTGSLGGGVPPGMVEFPPPPRRGGACKWVWGGVGSTKPPTCTPHVLYTRGAVGPPWLNLPRANDIGGGEVSSRRGARPHPLPHFPRGHQTGPGPGCPRGRASRRPPSSPPSSSSSPADTPGPPVNGSDPHSTTTAFRACMNHTLGTLTTFLAWVPLPSLTTKTAQGFHTHIHNNT